MNQSPVTLDNLETRNIIFTHVLLLLLRLLTILGLLYGFAFKIMS